MTQKPRETISNTSRRKRFMGSFQRRRAFLLCLLIWVTGGWSWAQLPDGRWLNGKPESTGTVLTAIVFVPPTDLQLVRVSNVWKKLEKRYKPLGAEFIVAATHESAFEFSDVGAEEIVEKFQIKMPVYLDANGYYAKQFKAFAFPTVVLLPRTGKIVNFDPGSFNPAAVEKSIQKLFRENGVGNLPAREFTSDADFKLCPYPDTFYLDAHRQKALGDPKPVTNDQWRQEPYGLRSLGKGKASLTFDFSGNAAGVVARSKNGNGAKITIGIDDGKTQVLTVKATRVYEIGSHLGSSTHKLQIETLNPDVELLAIQALTSCWDEK